MKVLISPAKSLDFTTPTPIDKYTVPRFLDASQKVHRVLVKKSPKQLSDLMSISDSLAQLNWERNQKWIVPFPEKEAKQAVFAFNGDVYTGLDAYTLSEDKINSAQNTLRILSGLYGILLPLDQILPYRLEMGTQLPIGKAKNLHEFWKTKLTTSLNNEMEKGELLVNLASKEYAGAIDFKKIKNQVITPEFKEYKDGNLKIISFYAKKARGLMSRYIIEHNIESTDDLKGFDYEGYAWEVKLSTDTQLIFTR